MVKNFDEFLGILATNLGTFIINIKKLIEAPHPVMKHYQPLLNEEPFYNIDKERAMKEFLNF